MELVTGHAGSTHITAEQVSRLLKGATATDSTTVQRLNVGNLAALSYADATMEIATGEMLLNGFHVTFEESESIPLDATVESTNSRIDKIVLEIIQDNTTSYQTAELVIVQGEEAETPTAPDTPTEPDVDTEEFLAVGVIAQVTVTADAITEFTDLTNLYGGNYVELTDYETDKTNLQNADIIIKKEVPWYATSSTAESTTAKVATCNQTGFALETGAKVIVKFDYTNTASSPTLNVNSTGDIAIVAYGTTAPTLFWLAGDVVEFTYDGTSWVMHPTQGQVNTLNSNLTNLLTWTVASDFKTAYQNCTNEVMVIMYYRISDVANGTTFTFPKLALDNITETAKFTNGYYYNSNSYASYQVQIDADKTGTFIWTDNGAVISGGRVVEIYYR